jgi:hypothetical protein
MGPIRHRPRFARDALGNTKNMTASSVKMPTPAERFLAVPPELLPKRQRFLTAFQLYLSLFKPKEKPDSNGITPKNVTSFLKYVLHHVKYPTTPEALNSCDVEVPDEVVKLSEEIEALLQLDDGYEYYWLDDPQPPTISEAYYKELEGFAKDLHMSYNDASISEQTKLGMIKIHQDGVHEGLIQEQTAPTGVAVKTLTAIHIMMMNFIKSIIYGAADWRDVLYNNLLVSFKMATGATDDEAVRMSFCDIKVVLDQSGTTFANLVCTVTVTPDRDSLLTRKVSKEYTIYPEPREIGCFLLNLISYATAVGQISNGNVNRLADIVHSISQRPDKTLQWAKPQNPLFGYSTDDPGLAQKTTPQMILDRFKKLGVIANIQGAIGPKSFELGIKQDLSLLPPEVLKRYFGQLSKSNQNLTNAFFFKGFKKGWSYAGSPIIPYYNIFINNSVEVRDDVTVGSRPLQDYVQVQQHTNGQLIVSSADLENYTSNVPSHTKLSVDPVKFQRRVPVDYSQDFLEAKFQPDWDFDSSDCLNKLCGPESPISKQDLPYINYLRGRVDNLDDDGIKLCEMVFRFADRDKFSQLLMFMANNSM